MNKVRENGFYWVQFQDKSWNVAEYYNGKWSITEVEGYYDDNDFIEIAETLLRKDMPKEKTVPIEAFEAYLKVLRIVGYIILTVSITQILIYIFN